MYLHYCVRVLQGDGEFLTSGLLERLSEHRDDFSLAATDKDIVILQRNMNHKEVV